MHSNAWKSYFFWCRVCTVPAVVQLFSLISPVFLCRDVILVFLVPFCTLVCTVPAVVQLFSLISPVFLCRDVILVFLVPFCTLVCTVPAVVQLFSLISPDVLCRDVIRICDSIAGTTTANRPPQTLVLQSISFDLFFFFQGCFQYFCKRVACFGNCWFPPRWQLFPCFSGVTFWQRGL
jgi:hypothetical protein